MVNQRNILIHLHHMRSITRKMLRYICNHPNLLENIFTYTISDLKQIFSIDTNRALRMYNELHADETNLRVHDTNKSCEIITIFDGKYPHSLKDIPDPPLVLYMKGNLHLLQEVRLISVIGTRQPSDLAFDKVKHILTPIIRKQWVIVSGFALGIDSFAHRFTLQSGGNTIAILGSGFDAIYPKQHQFLFEQMEKKGLLISEYPPHIRPQKYHFPERNRIISGISLATLVIEAKERSGTMITVDQALEQGKDVYAVPGNPFELEASGCNKLIQEGAKLVVCGQDILTEWAYLYNNKG